MTNKEIASRILAHLKRFEADPVINKEIKQGGMSISPYYNVNAYGNPRGIAVIYKSFQGTNQLDKESAEKYLAWLDKGKVGTHRDAKVGDR